MAEVSSQLNASSLTSWTWSDCHPPSDFVNGHLSTVWPISVVVRVHRQLMWQGRTSLRRFTRRGPWPVWQPFARDSARRRRSTTTTVNRGPPSSYAYCLIYANCLHAPCFIASIAAAWKLSHQRRFRLRAVHRLQCCHKIRLEVGHMVVAMLYGTVVCTVIGR